MDCDPVWKACFSFLLLLSFPSLQSTPSNGRGLVRNPLTDILQSQYELIALACCWKTFPYSDIIGLPVHRPFKKA